FAVEWKATGCSLPSAELSCPRPPSIANGLHSGHSWASFPRGVTVSYSCSEGFQLLGNASITCTDSGLWSRPLPRCEGVRVPRCRLSRALRAAGSGQRRHEGLCGSVPTAIGCQVPEVQNGNVYNPQSTYRAGETLLFDCDAGYSSEGTAEARCQPGGTWDPPLLGCQRGECVRPCPMPPEVANGKHNAQDKAFFTAGMSVRYSCHPGYYLVGNAAVSCRASGNWSQPSPRCEGEAGLGPLGDNGETGHPKAAAGCSWQDLGAPALCPPKV
uniref:Sushi domain-containing protein n=1 Tax=Cyanistes caeruleus TaxID=156563 RepID=A0A8C0U6P0_CYACU